MFCIRAVLIVVCLLTTLTGRESLAQDCPQGPILYVDQNGPNGSSGASWDDAFLYLQDAIGHANGLCDAGVTITEIRIAEGVYYPDEAQFFPITDDDRDATFWLNGPTALRGGFAGYGAFDPDEQLGVSYLSGDIATGNISDNSRVVLTLTGNWTGTLIQRIGVMQATNDVGNGGGIFAECPNLVLDKVTIDSNRAIEGGGMFATCDTLELLDSTVQGNMVDGLGGGMLVYASSIYSTNTLFIKNAADLGGGMYLSADSIEIRDADIRRNFANSGANVALSEFGNCAFVKGRITGGSTINDDACLAGGGVWAVGGGRLTFVNGTYASNKGDQGAFLDSSDVDLIEIWNSSVSFNRCPLVANSATVIHVVSDGALDIRLTSMRDYDEGVAAMVRGTVADFSISNSIIQTEWSADSLDVSASTYVHEYSNLEGEGSGFNGNIDSDPFWSVDIQVDCWMWPDHVDAGENSLIPLDEFDVDENSNFTEELPIDLYGNIRVVNEIVDMGAIECQ